MKTTIEDMECTMYKKVETAKDGEVKEKHIAKLESGDGIVIVISQQTEIDLGEGEKGLTVTIDNPQTRIDAPKAEIKVDPQPKSKASKALDEMGRSPKDVGKAIKKEQDKASAAADEKLKKAGKA